MLNETVLCAVSGGVNEGGQTAGLFAHLEKRCPNLRRLYLSNVKLTAPLPASVEVLILSESSLSASALSVSRFYLKAQTDNLPRLRDVELLSVKLRKGTMAALPAGVERLRIQETNMPATCFLQKHKKMARCKAGRQAVVSRLAEVDLSDSTQLTFEEIVNVAKTWPHLIALKLNGCFTRQSMTSNGLALILPYLGRLEVLEANGMSLTDQAVYAICRYLCGSLRRLSIAGCPLTNLGASRIASGLTKLEWLNVSGCRQIKDKIFFSFVKITSLRFLDVSRTLVTNDTVNLLESAMPTCEIVHSLTCRKFTNNIHRESKSVPCLVTDYCYTLSSE